MQIHRKVMAAMVDSDLNASGIVCGFDGQNMTHDSDGTRVVLRRELTTDGPDGLVSWCKDVDVTPDNVFPAKLPHAFRNRLHCTPVYFTLAIDTDHTATAKRDRSSRISTFSDVMKTLKRTWETQKETCETPQGGDHMNTPSSQSGCSDSEFEGSGTSSSGETTSDEETQSEAEDQVEGDTDTEDTQLMDTEASDYDDDDQPDEYDDEQDLLDDRGQPCII